MANQAIWYIEAQGKTVGPFSPEQLREFLARGQLHLDVKATAQHLNGSWMPLRDVLQENTATLHLPPRPELSKTSAHAGPAAAPAKRMDPAVSLFDALQAARERKAKQSTHDESIQQLSRTVLPPQAMLFGAAFIMVAALVFGIMQMAKKAEVNVATSNLTSTPAEGPAAQMPVKAAARPALPATSVAPPAVAPMRASAPAAASPFANSAATRALRQPMAAPKAEMAERERDRDHDRDRDRDRDRDSRDRDDRDRERDRDADSASASNEAIDDWKGPSGSNHNGGRAPAHAAAGTSGLQPAPPPAGPPAMNQNQNAGAENGYGDPNQGQGQGQNQGQGQAYPQYPDAGQLPPTNPGYAPPSE